MAKIRWGVALFAVLATACGSGPAPDAAPLDLSGVVLLQDQDDPHLDEIVFADPATGAVKTVLPLPGRDTSLHRLGEPTSKLDLVSPDGQYATLDTGEGVEVFRLDTAERRYERTAVVPDPGQGARFRNPKFGRTGSKLFFDDGKAVYSVDYRQLGAPAKEATLAPDGYARDWWLSAEDEVLTWQDAKHAGDGFSYLAGASGAIAYAVYDEPGATYDFVAALDATTVLLSAATGTDEHGVLVRLHLDNGKPQLTKLVERSEPRILKAAAAPDRTTVLFQTAKGEFFASPVTPGAVARPALPQLPPAAGRQLVGWA